VYFPRVLIPLAAVVAPLVDLTLAFLLLLAMVAWYGVAVSTGILLVPAFTLLAVVVALAVGLWLASLNVRYRDVRHAVPFAIQVWMLASPIVYPLSLVPEPFRLLYALNPMVGVIEGFRWGLLGRAQLDVGVVVVGSVVAGALLLGGLVYFARQEPVLADVI
jgi:lipopolysaccharide transport system permease protein